MKRLTIAGIVVLLIAMLAALVFVGWNVYSLRQTQASAAPDAAYGRRMMRGYAEPNATQDVTTTTPFGRGGMLGRGMMRGNAVPNATQGATSTTPFGRGGMLGRGMMGGMMGGNFSSAPSTNAVPPVAPTIAPSTNAGTSSSAASSSASSIASSASSATPGVLSKSGNGYTGKAGNLNVALTMNPAPAAFSTTTFDITLTDEKGAAVSDAKITLDLTMPSMWMPQNKPQAQSLGDGKYQAAGRFTMRGGWRINVIIERGGQKQNAYFDIRL